jgi:putative ABC transport system permease protein
MIACLTIGLLYGTKLQYDKKVPGGQSIYRIYNERKIITVSPTLHVFPPAYTKISTKGISGMENTARILLIRDKFLMEVGDKKAYEEKGLFVDASFPRYFN